LCTGNDSSGFALVEKVNIFEGLLVMIMPGVPGSSPPSFSLINHCLGHVVKKEREAHHSGLIYFSNGSGPIFLWNTGYNILVLKGSSFPAF
jgi:hypothetical protein